MTPIQGGIELCSISGLQLTIHPLGARIISLIVPTQQGPKQIVESYPTLQEFKTSRKYSGATIGPFANRIRNGQFVLDGVSYQLEANKGFDTLHSGSKGLHLYQWNVVEQSDFQLLLEAERSHLEDGFPGNRKFTCKYSLEEDDIIIQFGAKTDRPTIVNLTNHSYFNLDHVDNLDNHFFMIESNGLLELDDQLIPTGKVIPTVGQNNLSVFQRLEGRVFDRNFILSNNGEIELASAAYCPNTDITLEVYTDQPGIQFYTGNKKFFAFETQHFPDSPNNKEFPTTTITKDKSYSQYCIYRLSY